MAEQQASKVLPAGLLNGVLFFAVVLVGSGYIVFSKLNGVSAEAVTLVPVAIMVAYALLLGVSRFFRLRDDQSGDNLYYMGFLFTLTSLGVSLYQYSSAGSAEQIVKNFGVAIASTIAGIALRIFFNQMRRDPIEVEQTARLELADASRRVRRELEGAILEFSHFRRSTQQSLEELVAELKEVLIQAKTAVVGQLDDFAENSSRPLEEASKKSGHALDSASIRIAGSLDQIAAKLTASADKITASAAETASSLDGVVSKLHSMQTPEQVIEIKLNPAIQGLTRAVNTFAKASEAQAQALGDRIEETRSLVSSVADLVANMKTAIDQPQTQEQPRVSDVPEVEPPTPAGGGWLPWQRR